MGNPTESHTLEKLTLLQAGSRNHAKTSAQPEKAQASTESGLGSGERWQESFAKWDQDSCSWKIRQLWLFEDLEQSLATWPRWGSMHDGECFQEPRSARNTFEKDSGYLPTPTAHNAKEGNYPAEKTRKTPTLATHAGGKINPEWTEHLMGWPSGWTALKPSGMAKFQEWLLSHGGH